MKAMILAAGLGTRLMPLTAEIPKALVEINGVTLLELAIRKLSANGFKDIIVNIHHFGHQIRAFLLHRQFPGVHIEISDETDLLLDTGGGILKARWFLDGDQPFLVYNVDVITSLDLRELYDTHAINAGLATLAVTKRGTSRYLLFNRENRLCGWKDMESGRELWSALPDPEAEALAFSGIHVISPSIFRHTPVTGRLSIIEAYLSLAAKENIFAFRHPQEGWFDLGKADQISEIASYIEDHPEFMPR